MWLRMLAENRREVLLLAVARQRGDTSLPGNGSYRYDLVAHSPCPCRADREVTVRR